MKGESTEGKGNTKNWRQPCSDYWKPDGCSLEHSSPKYHPRRQPGRCAICGSTKHYTSQCKRLVKPKMKNAEYKEEPIWNHNAEWEGVLCLGDGV